MTGRRAVLLQGTLDLLILNGPNRAEAACTASPDRQIPAAAPSRRWPPLPGVHRRDDERHGRQQDRRGETDRRATSRRLMPAPDAVRARRRGAVSSRPDAASCSRASRHDPPRRPPADCASSAAVRVAVGVPKDEGRGPVQA